MSRALEFLRKSQASGGKVTVRGAARRFGVPRSSLQDRANGKKTRHEVRQLQQTLSPNVELVLRDWIRYWGSRGVPMTTHAARAKAMALAGRDVRKVWLYRFKRRHPELKTVWSSTIDGARARQINETVVQDFYDKLIGEIAGSHIPPENIFNMDEKGVVCGQHDRVKVWVDGKQKNTVNIGEKERELTTIIECVCADGESISPMIIFKGVRQSREWYVENDHGMNAT
jgi:hypothetical protein